MKVDSPNPVKVKYDHKVQLEQYFSQRVFRVTKKQNILGLSTRRELFLYYKPADVNQPLSGAAKDGGFWEISAPAMP